MLLGLSGNRQLLPKGKYWSYLKPLPIPPHFENARYAEIKNPIRSSRSSDTCLQKGKFQWEQPKKVQPDDSLRSKSSYEYKEYLSTLHFRRVEVSQIGLEVPIRYPAVFLYLEINQ